ncbi:hypothetical protein FOZ62_029023, partial [Perkinsus olseni]
FHKLSPHERAKLCGIKAPSNPKEKVDLHLHPDSDPWLPHAIIREEVIVHDKPKVPATGPPAPPPPSNKKEEKRQSPPEQQPLLERDDTSESDEDYTDYTQFSYKRAHSDNWRAWICFGGRFVGETS